LFQPSQTQVFGSSHHGFDFLDRDQLSCNMQWALRACQENRVESVAHPVSSPQLPRVNFGSATFETVCFSFLSFWLGPTPGKMTMTVFVKSRNMSSRQENVRFAHSNFLRVCILRR